MRERWKDVIGLEGLYRVSDLGRVRSLGRSIPHNYGGTRRLKERILRPTPPRGSRRYLSVSLWKNGIQTTMSVHKIVAAAWIGPCPDSHEVCHMDGDGSNNAVRNLRYGTHASNELDKRKHGTDCVKRVRRSDGIEFTSMRVAAKETSCNFSSLSAVCRGKRKTAGGYGWKYI